MSIFSEYAIIIAILIFLHILIISLIWRKPKKSIKNRHVVVTGGSSGIGLWLGVHAAKLGANVTLVARNVRLLGINKINALASRPTIISLFFLIKF